VTEEMVASVSEQIEVPLIVGGGITSAEKAAAICQAGADVVVVGNAIEKDRSLIQAISEAVHG
jgi:putative glycerol-1-phosphate prenyltransferase